MFTGIIQSRGTVRAVERNSDGVRLRVDMGQIDDSDVAIGDSIAVNGVCLTVTRKENNEAQFDVSTETLSKCLVGNWQVGTRVNLEKAMTLNTPLGGHLVSGHVDGVGSLLSRRDDADSTWMKFTVPRSIGRFIAIKGSVTVDGISLTSNNVYDVGEVTHFELTLVPHTLTMTTLETARAGDEVHLEIDLIARYLERMHQSDSTSAALD